MATFSLCNFNSKLHSLSHHSSSSTFSAILCCHSHFYGSSVPKHNGIRGTITERRRRRSSVRSNRFVVLSAHSNPKIVKSNRKSRYGQTLSPYDSDDDIDGVVGGGEDEDDDNWFSDDEFSDTEDDDADKKKLQKGAITKQGHLSAKVGKSSLERRNSYTGSRGKLKTRKSTDNKYPRLRRLRFGCKTICKCKLGMKNQLHSFLNFLYIQSPNS